MIEIMIIEDEEQIRRLLGKMIEKVEGFAVVSEAETVQEAVSLFRDNPVDVAFVDIDLNGESGLDCARSLCDISPKVKIIFATAHSEYMADAFEIYAFDYLVKPFNLERITRTLNRIKESESRSAGEGQVRYTKVEGLDNPVLESSKQENTRREQYKDKLAIKGKEEIQIITTKNILFVERVNGTTRIVTIEGIYQTSMSLTDIQQKLNPAEFMRSHRSYIINTSRIGKLTQYGRWTYAVAFAQSRETALMTYENYEKLKELIL